MLTSDTNKDTELDLATVAKTAALGAAVAAVGAAAYDGAKAIARRAFGRKLEEVSAARAAGLFGGAVKSLLK